jgi:hypothetical protein
MAIRSKIIIITILVWLISSSAYAYFYIASILNQSGLQGYESEWQFQLLMFSIFRFPFLVFALLVIIGVEVKFLRYQVCKAH